MRSEKEELFTIDINVPGFPGFYGSHYDCDYTLFPIVDNEIRNEVEMHPLIQLDCDKITCLKGNSCNFVHSISDELDIDIVDNITVDKYREDIAKNFTGIIRKYLIEMEVIKELVYKQIESPREYNFRNDQIAADVTITKENRKSIFHLIRSDIKDFDVFLGDRFTSRPGFTSFYPNNHVEFLREGIDNPVVLSSILDWIIGTEYGYEAIRDEVMSEVDIFEYIDMDAISKAAKEGIDKLYEARGVKYNIKREVLIGQRR